MNGGYRFDSIRYVPELEDGVRPARADHTRDGAQQDGPKGGTVLGRAEDTHTHTQNNETLYHAKDGNRIIK
jgi:hypothetical protein